jgi:repressor LexA
MEYCLTPRQKAIADLIISHRAQHGLSPTMQEIGDVIGISKVTVHEHIAQLVRKGVVRREPGMARSLMVSPEYCSVPTASASIPLLGAIAAGSPIEAIQNSEHVDLAKMVRGGAGSVRRYALRVRGDSMIEDHIADGDLVIVEERTSARDGETVVALVNDSEATLKRFHRDGDLVRLDPANSNMKPMFYAPHAVKIQGVLVGLVRGA